MPILNYTTDVKAAKTVGEINEILSKHKARKITIDNDDYGNPSGVTFAILKDDQMVFFALPCNYKGVQSAMKKDGKACDEKKAIMIAWRIIKDWIEAQLALVQAEQATMLEVFLPYAITRDGKTVFQFLSKDNTLFLNQ